MIDIKLNVVANSAAVLMLLLLRGSSLKTIFNDKARYRMFLAMIYFTILQAVAYTVTYIWEDSLFYGNYRLAVLSTVLLYVINALFELTLAAFVRSHISERLDRKFVRMGLIALPSAVIILGSIVNIFVPVFFEVNRATMVNRRTELDLLARIVPVFYFGYAIVASYIATYKGRQYLFLPIVKFMLPIAVAIVAETIVYGISLLPVAYAISLTFLAVSLLHQEAFVDRLSGLYTRAHLMNYMLSAVSQRSPSYRLMGILLDIDEFKAINDTYGHIVGDDAVSRMGELIREASHGHAKGFRYAGDEFVMLINAKSDSEVFSVVERLKRLTGAFNEGRGDSYRLSFSYGISEFDYASDTIDSFLTKMDDNMYSDKKRKQDEKSSDE